MSQQPNAPETASTTPQSATEPVGADLEQCRQVLRNLLEVGNEIAVMLARQALSQENAPAEAQKAAASYNAVAQSLRRTVMLQEKLAKPRKTSVNRVAARKRIIRDVEDAIESQAEPDEQETLRAEFLERLDSPDLEDDINARPLADIIADICRDLGVGAAALPDTNPFKRRIPHDIAILNARAAQLPNTAPSAELATLIATAPPPPAKPRRRRHYPEEDIEAFKKRLPRMTDEELEWRIARGRPPRPA